MFDPKLAEQRANKLQLAAGLAAFLLLGVASYFAAGWGGAAFIGAIFALAMVRIFGEASKTVAKLRKENSATNEPKKGPHA